MPQSRRRVMANAALGMLTANFLVWPGVARGAGDDLVGKPYSPPAGPRTRLVYVNDLCGDIDGLFATVHAIFSPSSQLRSIIGTTTGRGGETTQLSVKLASEMLALTNRESLPVYAGAEHKLSEARKPIPSAGTQAIIDEAMREDTKLPLFVGVGGGLTEVASALMIEPRIADRMTLVWIGGDTYPAGGKGETNFNIDPLAAQYVFNESRVRIWQIPRAVYATCLVSDTELQAYVAPCGAIGRWLYGKVIEAAGRWGGAINIGETWCLGDSPLVVLTSLADWGPSEFRPAFRYERHGSSPYDEVIAPILNADGTFTPRSDGRKIRIYKGIDTRMMFGDFFAKLRVNAAPTDGVNLSREFEPSRQF